MQNLGTDVANCDHVSNLHICGQRGKCLDSRLRLLGMNVQNEEAGVVQGERV